LNEALKRF